MGVLYPKQKEKLREPSHSRALSLDESQQLLDQSGLKDLKQGSYKVDMELEKQLRASFPNLGNDEKVREIFRQDLAENRLGMETRHVDGEIHFDYPIAIFTGRK